MSWGIKITIVYICFVALIVSMVVISSNNRSELVAKDYYAQELNYQKRIDAIKNENGLAVSIMHAIEQKSVVLFYPANERGSDFSGEVVFFRPSDSSKDLTLPLHFDETGKLEVDKNSLSKGVYKICITWHNNNTDYYKEDVINL